MRRNSIGPGRRHPARLLLSLLLGAAAASAAPRIQAIAGTGAAGFSGDGGPARLAQLNQPSGLERGPDGALYVCDTGNQRIRRIAPDGTITTFAGNGQTGWSGDGGPAAAARLNEPWEIRFDAEGNAFWVERMSHVVRERVRRTGLVRTVAGIGRKGFSGDGGPAIRAAFDQPHSLAFDRAGVLFVGDIINNRVRRIDLATGIVTTVAGTGAKAPTRDGGRIEAEPLSGPRAMEFDREGVLWVVLRNSHSVVTIDWKADRIRRVAGTGEKGYSGDGGPALAASFDGPKAISLGPDGKVYVADTENHVIRRIDRQTGRIERVAGTGRPGDGPDGDPLACGLRRPHGLLAEADGSVVIGDTENNRILLLRQ